MPAGQMPMAISREGSTAAEAILILAIGHCHEIHIKNPFTSHWAFPFRAAPVDKIAGPPRHSTAQ
jgi:hypothetical protein